MRGDPVAPLVLGIAALVFSGAAQAQQPGFAGSETCAACHEDIGKAFQKSRHGALDKDKARGWETRACESCHGPGAKHAESGAPADIVNPAKLAPAQVDKNCLTCHRGQPTHAGRIQSGHARNQVACVSCHSMHKPPPEVALSKAAAANQQCATCHASEAASFQRPFGHKLANGTGHGAMSCLDCHNPHGGFPKSGLRSFAASEPGCLRCHGDKRGPFAFEHAPVRLEGCASCHVPHGASNPRMLARNEIVPQCLECHANVGTAAGGVPPAFHDLRSARFRNCTTCHVKIHGSHVNRAFLR